MLDWKGYLWLGTDGGLLQMSRRGNGLNKHRVYTTLDGLTHMRIHALFGNGSTLWIGTESGLAKAKWLGRGLKVVKTFPIKRVRGITAWKKQIWVATFGHGLYMLGQGGKAKPFVFSRGGIKRAPLYPQNRLTSLAVFAERLWLASMGHGVAMLTPTMVLQMKKARKTRLRRVRWLRKGKELPDDYVFQLTASKKHLLVSSTGGLRVFKKARSLRARFPLRSAMRVNTTKLLSRGFLPAMIGAFVLPKSSRKRASLSKRLLLCSVGHRVGFLGRGASRRWARRMKRTSLRFCGLYQNKLWVGLSEGIVELGLSPMRWRRWHRINALPSDNIASLAYQGRRLWVGTFDKGLSSLKGGKWRRYPEVFRQINQVVVSPEQDVWVATNRGLYRKKKRHRRFYRVYRGPCDVHVNGLFADKAGLYVASVSGVAVYSKRTHRWKCYRKRQGLKQKHFFVVLRTPDGTLWAGGSDGLVSFDGRKWRHYTRLQRHLPDDWVTTLFWHRKRLWVGTYSKGFSTFDPKSKKWQIHSDTKRFYVNPNAAAASGHLHLFGTMQGLVLWKNGTYQVKTSRHQLAGLDVTAMVKGQKGWWIATRSGLSLVKM